MSVSPPIAAFEAPDPARLAPLFPGYEIEFLIATGGMGAVYKAVQLSLERSVAIKILPREFGQDESYRASFEAEAKAMARLNHPNLIGVYDFGEVDGMLFIIMEFVPGKTLFHSAHGIAIAANEAARIVADVCMGLAHAHEYGILHRDIKPGNILLDQQARPKIGDFGLARPIGSAVKDGETIFGTPHYTAPEVLKFPNSVGVRADIFSVGVVLHELLTGRLPAAVSRPPSAICGCDHRFDAIVRRATHPSAHLRYASAAEMANDLRAIIHAVPAPAVSAKVRPIVPPARHQAPVRKAIAAPAKSSGNMVSLAVIGAIVVVVAAFFIAPTKVETSKTDSDSETSPTPTPTPPKPSPVPTPANNPPVVPKPKPTLPKLEPPPKPKTVEQEPPPKPEPAPVLAKIEPVTPVRPVVATVPSFDVAAFVERVRGVMQQRAAPIFAAHEKALEKNLESCERRVKREIRQLDKARRPHVEPLAETSFRQWRNNGNSIPKSLAVPPPKDDKAPKPPPNLGSGGKDEDKAFFKEVHDIHASYLAKQTKLEQKLEYDILQLSLTYVLGLKQQMDKLTAGHDVPAAEQLQAEIRATQDRPHYFNALVRGIDPNAPPAPAPEVKPEGKK
ncbi:MAG: serine/threonine-protein kinase [Verrucomicrobiota bacterium]